MQVSEECKMENVKCKMKRLITAVFLFFFSRTWIWYQFNDSDFRRCQKTYGWTPCAGTSAYIKMSII